MNTPIQGDPLQAGIRLPPLSDLVPESRTVFLSRKDKIKGYAERHTAIAVNLLSTSYSANNQPTWKSLTQDALKLQALITINMVLLQQIAIQNSIKARENLKAEMDKRAQRLTTPQLVRTESGPVNALLSQMGQPQVQPRSTADSGRKDSARLVTLPGGPQTVTLQKPEPTSVATQPAGRITGATAPTLQENQGNPIQIVDKEQTETLRVLECHKQATKRITRAQMSKWTKDPRIRAQVLTHL